MKNLKYILAAFLLLLSACDDSFNPKSEFQEKYVLSSVIQANTKGQNIRIEAFLSRLYDVEGTNPYTNPDDPAIEGALIQILHRNNVYDMTMQKLAGQNERYQGDLINYITVIQSPRPGEDVGIRAVLNDGTTLSASVQFPKSLHFELNYPYVRGFTSNIDQSVFGNSLTYRWKGSLEEIYFPELTIIYEQYEDGVWVTKTREVPREILSDGTEVYPDYIYDYEIDFNFSAIDQIVESLGEGLEFKSDIKLGRLFFNLTSLERNLANYYSSTNGFLDSYSIRLDEEIYSNISGGLGIFGAAISFEYDLSFDRAYSVSFGYTF